jgi:hypothetical protein
VADTAVISISTMVPKIGGQIPPSRIPLVGGDVRKSQDNTAQPPETT